MLKVFSVGPNVTIIESSNGPVYKYQYKREYYENSPLYITYDNDLSVLIELMEKEKIIYSK